MERHSIDEQQAFNMLREQVRRTQRTIVDIARSVIESHRLLANMGDDPADEPHAGGEPG
jgi:hypothetical protein